VDPKATRSTDDEDQSNSETEEVVDAWMGKLVLQRENGTNNLVGRYFENSTETFEVRNELQVLVEFTDPAQPNRGVVSLSHDDEDFKQLVQFDLQPQHNGFHLSYGALTNNNNFFYQMSVGNWDRTIVTLIPKSVTQNQNQLVTYIARKIPVIVDKTFWSKYGMFIMLGGFFMFNQWVQKKAKGMQPPQGQAPEAGTGSTTTTEVASSTTTTEESDESKKKK
jgi:hypothetical protein